MHAVASCNEGMELDVQETRARVLTANFARIKGANDLQSKPVDEVVGNARPLRPAPQPSGPRLLIDLAGGRCKFPVSDPPPGRGVEMLFCAEPVAQPGANYCSRHTEITRVSSSAASPFSPSPRAPSPAGRAP